MLYRIHRFESGRTSTDSHLELCQRFLASACNRTQSTKYCNLTDQHQGPSLLRPPQILTVSSNYLLSIIRLFFSQLIMLSNISESMLIKILPYVSFIALSGLMNILASEELLMRVSISTSASKVYPSLRIISPFQ